MQAGGLHERITIEHETEVPDGGGGWTIEWDELATGYARAIHQSGNERLEAAQLQYERAVEFLIRYRDDVTVQERVVWNGEIYAIHDVDTTGRRDGELRLIAVRDPGAS